MLRHSCHQGFVFALITGLAVLTSPVISQAQSGPIPAYDYDRITPGTQPSVFGPDYDARVFRTFQLVVPLYVDRLELQNILPAGFSAIANPTGSDTAVISLGFIYHQRAERGGVVDGPASVFAVTTTARNEALGRNETLVLANEQDDPLSVKNANDVFGEGTTRLADIRTELRENGGQLDFWFDVTDEEIGLRVRVRAVGPAGGGTRVLSNPSAGVTRAVEGAVARRSFRQALQYDNTNVPVTPESLTIASRVLNLPGGRLHVTGYGVTMNFQRWRENIQKLGEASQ